MHTCERILNYHNNLSLLSSQFEGGRRRRYHMSVLRYRRRAGVERYASYVGFVRCPLCLENTCLMNFLCIMTFWNEGSIGTTERRNTDWFSSARQLKHRNRTLSADLGHSSPVVNGLGNLPQRPIYKRPIFRLPSRSSSKLLSFLENPSCTLKPLPLEKRLSLSNARLRK